MSNAPTPSNPDTTTEERDALELFERLRAATLGEYEILSELGRGGMATVFLAHEISLDRKVAIKVMSPAMVHGAGLVERFKREARTAANLSHPNIIPIYSVREVDGLLFCVIKLVQGTALDVVMKELGQLPIPMVHGILAQVGGALGYAHRHGVVHRDIKPGNILIDDEGWAVVTDFGIAKVTENEGLTTTGMAIGTPTYMSPEQATADVVTGASDQYSLGVVAYEMLAGRPPFVGTSMMQLMYAHNNDDPPALQLFREGVPLQLCEAVVRMLRKDPATRFHSMEEAVAAAGARPLAPDDPTRTQLIALAKTGLTHRIVVQTTTPRSPIPRVGRRKTGVAKPTRNPLMLAVAAVSLLGIGFFGARMLTRENATPEETSSAQPPAIVSTTDSVAAPAALRVDSTPRTRAPNDPPRVPATQPRVQPSPVAGRGDAAALRASLPLTDSGRGITQRGESVVTTPLVQKAESIPVLPNVSRPPVSAAASSTQPPPTVTRPVDPATEVTSVIQAYARALAGGDLAAARRLYPGMPTDQREGLEALWRGGGAMTPSWSVTDIVITGDVATARVRGSNVVVAGRGQTPSSVPVSLRASLERRGTEWRLVALIN